MTAPERVLVTRGQSKLLVDMPRTRSKAGNFDGLTTFSGRKIIEILKKNPKKDPEKYDEDDIAHMRKVAAYCKR